MKLFIDDIRIASDIGYKNGDFLIARDFDTAVRIIQTWKPQFISFDHDLGNTNTKTGYDIVKWMVDMEMSHLDDFISTEFTFNVHSANPIGAENIQKYMDNYIEYKFGERIGEKFTK